MKYLVFFAVTVVLLVACQNPPARNTDSGVPNVASGIKDVTPTEAQTAVSKAYSQFVDVRTAEEYSGGHAARAINIPLDTLSANLDKLEKNEPVYLICRTDNRSRQAAQILIDAGFSHAIVIKGGTEAWMTADLPMETKPPHSVPPVK